MAFKKKSVQIEQWMLFTLTLVMPLTPSAVIIIDKLTKYALDKQQWGGLKTGWTNWDQGIVVSDTKSSWGPVNGGVPPGLNIGADIFINDWRMGWSAPSASSQMIKTREKCLISLMAVLSFRWTSTDWRTGQREISWSSIKGNTMSCIWGGIK